MRLVARVRLPSSVLVESCANRFDMLVLELFTGQRDSFEHNVDIGRILRCLGIMKILAKPRTA